MKKINFLVGFLICGSILSAQEVSSLYYMRNNPLRHSLNPAFQPIQGVYVDLPIIPSFYAGAYNNSLNYKSLMNKAQDTYFWENGGEPDFVYDKLKKTTRLKQEFKIDLLSFGFRKDKSYFTFGISEREDFFMNAPRDLFKVGLYGTESETKKHYDFSKTGFRVQAWTEIALGFSKEINEKWTAGAKAKLLIGESNATMKIKTFDFNLDKYGWDSRIDGTLNGTVPYASYGIDEEQKLKDMSVDFDGAKAKDFTSGMGVSFDLGATYKPIDHLTLSASLLDLGFIHWNKNRLNMNPNGEWSYIEEEGDKDTETYWERYGAEIEKEIDYKTTTGGKYSTMLSAKVMLGAEYGVLDDKITFGLASKTSFFQKTLFEDLTVSANFMPKSWFNFSLSYTCLGGEYSDFGAAMGARLGIFYLYVASDFIPVSYNDDKIPYLNKEANVSFGVLMTFKNRDKKDKSNTEDNSVWNQLDNMEAALIAQDTVKVELPKDSDNDGVIDELDKCSDTPEAAKGTVDENGCPKDSDNDGVADYLDQCADTPEAAKSTVDGNGCPKDSDGDGIADYLDKCPTIAGIAENNGCPEVKAEVKQIFQQALQGIQFESGKDVILPSSYSILNNVVDVMKSNPDYKLRITGHTDNTGDKQKNQILSEKRAAAVKAYLENKGIASDRLTSEGKGQDNPVASNDTVQGRQQNRRVEFTVIF